LGSPSRMEATRVVICAPTSESALVTTPDAMNAFAPGVMVTGSLAVAAKRRTRSA